jgi:hypothetical protein
METSRHVHLLIEYRDDKPAVEPIHAAELSDSRYRLLYSPGFVQGIAAGDEFRLLDEHGAFEVTRRAGNLAVQVFSSESVAPVVEELTRSVFCLGGVLDGLIERTTVFTIPVAAGFPASDGLDHPAELVVRKSVATVSFQL